VSGGIVHWLVRGVVLLAVALGSLSASAQEHAAFVAPGAPEDQAGPVSAGNTAWVSGTQGAGVRVHTAPLLQSDILGSLSASAPVLVLEGPIAADGSNWYRVSSVALPRSGWVDGQFLAATPPGQQAGGGIFPVGSTARVSGAAAGLRVHSAPFATSQQVELLTDGTPVQVLEGPIASGGANWYRVGSTALTGSGWVDGQFLTSTAPGQPVTSGILLVGSTARVGSTDGAGLRVHSAPLVTSQQAGSLPDGTVVQVLQGPITADGFTWYQVSSAALPTPGWVVGGALSATSP
jgi:hypothetical protein